MYCVFVFVDLCLCCVGAFVPAYVRLHLSPSLSLSLSTPSLCFCLCLCLCLSGSVLCVCVLFCLCLSVWLFVCLSVSVRPFFARFCLVACLLVCILASLLACLRVLAFVCVMFILPMFERHVQREDAPQKMVQPKELEFGGFSAVKMRSGVMPKHLAKYIPSKELWLFVGHRENGRNPA